MFTNATFPVCWSVLKVEIIKKIFSCVMDEVGSAGSCYVGEQDARGGNEYANIITSENESKLIFPARQQLFKRGLTHFKTFLQIEV